MEPALTRDDYPLIGGTDGGGSATSRGGPSKAFSPSRRTEDLAYDQNPDFKALTDWYTSILFESGERLRLPMVSTVLLSFTCDSGASYIDDDGDNERW